MNNSIIVVRATITFLSRRKDKQIEIKKYQTNYELFQKLFKQNFSFIYEKLCKLNVKRTNFSRLQKIKAQITKSIINFILIYFILCFSNY